jgi:hypothetical protein
MKSGGHAKAGASRNVEANLSEQTAVPVARIMIDRLRTRAPIVATVALCALFPAELLAGVKFIPDEAVPTQAAAVGQEEPFEEAANMEAILAAPSTQSKLSAQPQPAQSQRVQPGAQPEAFARDSAVSASGGTLRMIPAGEEYEELKLRWEARFGGRRSDAFTEVISRRSDLATIAVGHTMSESSGRSDAWVMAIDDKGKRIWETSIGGSRDDRATAVWDLADGGLLVVGDTASETGVRVAGLVARLSPTGKVIWQRTLQGENDIALNDVIGLAGERVLVAGTSGNIAGYVAELDAEGEVVWEKLIQDAGPDIVHALTQLPNGDLLVVGERTDLFDSDAWALRLSPAGEPLWSRSYGDDGRDVFFDVALSADGSAMVVGSTFAEDVLEQGWLLQISEDPAGGWEKTFGGKGVDTLFGVTVLNDQSLILVGRTDAANSVAPNAWVLRVSNVGKLVKARALGAEYADGLTAIAARSDGSYSAVGFTHSDFDAPRDAYIALLGMPVSQELQPVYAAVDSPTLFVPGGGQLTTERASIEILGNVIHSRPVRQVFVDGKQTELLPNGAFVKQVSVPLGQTEIAIDAVDDRGIIGSTTITVVRTEQGQLQPGEGLDDLLESIDFGRYHALVIGNNEYPANDIPALRSAVNDAQAVADVLAAEYNFDVDLRLNATRGEIIAALDQKSRELGPQDNLLVYYAGHGYYDEDVDLGYWLPVDASLSDKSAWIRNSAITDSIKGMQAKHVLLVADSCFSGTLLRNVDVKRTGRFYEQMANRSARLVMTSGGIEPVMDEGGDGHSVFARNLLRRLKSSDRIIDGTSLYQAIREPVVMTSEQVPQYSNIRFIDSDGGDFLFVKHSELDLD